MTANLLYSSKFVRVANAAVAATTAVTTTVVDTQGYDSIAFVALLGDVTVNSVLGLAASSNTASSTSSPTPLTLSGAVTYTATATDADNKMMLIDIHKPRARYVYATLTRTAANAVVDGIVAILYNGHLKPETTDATMLIAAFKNDPTGT